MDECENEEDDSLEENPDTAIQEAEEIAYNEMKPKYLSDFISRYKYVVEPSAALKEDPVKISITTFTQFRRLTFIKVSMSTICRG